MRAVLALLVAAMVVVSTTAVANANIAVAAPIAHAAAVCADYPNQAAAQQAADTRDADGDGIYCESLPCPCLKPGSTAPPPTAPAPAPPSTTPTPVAPSPAPSAPPGGAPGTRRLVYSPFLLDGSLAPGLNVVRRSGECFIGSAGAAGAYRCMTGNLLRDPCYEDPADADSVVCVGDPWTKTVVRIALTEALPDPASDAVPRAWALELVSGSRCVFLSGGTAVVHGYRLNYACGRNRFIFGSPRTTNRFWTIRYSRSVTGKGMRFVKIKRAWR